MDNRELDKLFKIAKEQPTEISFDQVKDRFMNSIDDKSMNKSLNRKLLTSKKWFIMISSVLTIAVSIYLFLPHTIEKNKELKFSENSTINSKNIKLDKENSLTNNFQENHQTTPLVVDNLSDLITISNDSNRMDSLQNSVVIQSNQGKVKSDDGIGNKKIVNNPPLLDEYPFPKLTEDEIKANHKKKKQMLKALEKLESDYYTYFPSGTFEFQGNKCSLQSFFMQNTEVSNLEYRTFLFDLLIQGRKDEFLKAKPDQTLWVKLPYGEDNKLKDFYFSHPSYNNYPVVNVSREGAEMYCKWLITELFKTIDIDKQKRYNDTRLPSRAEWEYAASSCGKNMQYPWGDKLLNPSNCFLSNFKIMDNTKLLDSIQCPKKTTSTPFTSAEYATGNQDLLTHVKSYNPYYGLYNMSGNVAEMVYENYLYGISKNPGTAGGSWECDENQIKIEGEDKYKGIVDPNPAIGFRVVMTHLGHFK